MSFRSPLDNSGGLHSSMTELAQELEFESDHPFLFDSHPAMVARSLSVGIGMFAGKWKLSILWYLEQRSRRFGELASLLPGVTAKVLSYQLRELQDVGLISRTESVCPRHTVYALTEPGRAAMPLLRLLWQWGNWQLRREAHCAADDTSSSLR
jgi:DNA-binding HxlR family transcriptional regulator